MLGLHLMDVSKGKGGGGGGGGGLHATTTLIASLSLESWHILTSDNLVIIGSITNLWPVRC